MSLRALLREFESANFDGDRLLNEKQACEIYGCSPRTFQGWRLSGFGPPFVRISSRAVRYRRKDLLEWAESRLRRSTSDGKGKNT